ncbi:MAG: hypothetical protein CBB68_12360 [Rhodospirillaceae bacterium TMED8]|nr:hypothetical protein [Magnetovibrio sp.]OUT48903.1 MAG: hypothetical protein CBB68_12360 [Rhodospirillaceae bacterium TMED8]|tara:strand:+ start:1421 stop:1870 length:450 start_codon:yes stop_codon:yes gene_type:complete
MIEIKQFIFDQVTLAAEDAYPFECCGLLTGSRNNKQQTRVIRAVPSPNVTCGDPRVSFEIDPQIRFDLMRQIFGSSKNEKIIGHYHSHPDRPPLPSARDLAMAYEPELIWFIIGVSYGETVATAAHLLNSTGIAFTELKIVISEQKKLE